MAEANQLVDLEKAIEGLDGVLGCVILAGPDENPSEIQAFTRVGTDLLDVRQQIIDEVNKRGLEGSLGKVFVFELEAESQFGDRESLQQAAEVAEQQALARGPSTTPPQEAQLGTKIEPKEHHGIGRRPVLRRVVLGSTAVGGTEAEVVLGPEGGEVTGQARGEKTPHSLRVLAQATLEAASKLVGEDDFKLRGASLASVIGQEVVLVIVEVNGEFQTVGAVLVRGGPVSEATVRATLDAINRRLESL